MSSTGRRACAAVLLVTAWESGVAHADIVPLSRSSLTQSQDLSGFTSQSSLSFAPFSSHLNFAEQETSVTGTAISGYLRTSPFGLSTPMHPNYSFGRSDFTLRFRVDTETTFAITGSITNTAMTLVFRLTSGDANGPVLYTPTFTASGPLGVDTATLNYSGLLAPGVYTLVATSAGAGSGAGAPYGAIIDFQVNAAPAPDAGAALGLLALAATRRRRA